MAYDETLEIVPDILEWLEVEDGRSFTLKLREGHRWSDGHPLTAEDFRYFWEDVATNERSEEHTSELQSLMRISYAVFCLKKKNKDLNNYKRHMTLASCLS